MRDLNSQIARLCKRLVPGMEEGKFWGRRYSQEDLPRGEDAEEYFFYCALQAVEAGLAEHPRDYPSYNSFDDAVNGVERKFVVTDWTKYSNARRWNPDVDITRYQITYTLRYARLPGYEHLSQQEYRDLMYEKFERRRLALIEQRVAAGKGFAKPDELLNVKPGDRPRFTKKSSRTSHRPIVLCGCPVTRQERLSEIFETRSRYKSASAQFRAGNLTVKFPPGTYRPPLVSIAESIPLPGIAISA